MTKEICKYVKHWHNRYLIHSKLDIIEKWFVRKFYCTVTRNTIRTILKNVTVINVQNSKIQKN